MYSSLKKPFYRAIFTINSTSLPNAPYPEMPMTRNTRLESAHIIKQASIPHIGDIIALKYPGGPKTMATSHSPGLLRTKCGSDLTQTLTLMLTMLPTDHVDICACRYM